MRFWLIWFVGYLMVTFAGLFEGSGEAVCSFGGAVVAVIGLVVDSKWFRKVVG